MKHLLIAIASSSLILAACGTEPGSGEAVAGKTGKAAPEAGSECIIDPPAEPVMCTMDWRPVCGCDGKTYSNPCGARAAGVSDFTEGECSGEHRD